jgi:hypothetical protein
LQRPFWVSDPYSCLEFSFLTQVYMSTHVTCDPCAQSLAHSSTVTHLLRNLLSNFASTQPLLVSIPYPVRSRAQSRSASYYYTWYNVLTHNHCTLCDTVHMFLSHNHRTSHWSRVKGCDGRSEGFFQAKTVSLEMTTRKLRTARTTTDSSLT